MQIERHSDNHVTLTYTSEPVNPDGVEVQRTREFWAPSSGGYVRELREGKPGTLSPQVCRGLSAQGDTLYYDAGTDLAQLIEGEYEAMVAARQARFDF